MNNSHRFITALVAVGALFIGSSAVAQQPRPTLQGLQDQVNNTYTKAQVDAMVQQIVPAAVPRTGQSKCYDPSGKTTNEIDCPGTGQDGNKLAGVAPPVPRFVDNGNGTVTDMLTRLIWLKNANCFGLRDWQTALNDANNLANGQCGLTDGSTAGQWRLPNVKELHSLINFGFYEPALSNAVGTAKWTEGDAFSGVQSAYYWSSSSAADGLDVAWFVDLYNGVVVGNFKTFTYYVWPVRGGQ